MSKKSENLSDLNKKDRNKRHSSPFITVVKGVFFVVRVTLVPVSYLSAPSDVHSYRVPGKFICRLKSLFVGRKVYSSTTNKAIEDTKGVIRIGISKKDRQLNGRKKMYKRTNNDRSTKTYI
jgi:hypothetical protein